MKKILIICSIAVLSACSAKVIQLTQADADRMVQKFPGITFADLNEGKTLFEQKCNTCHNLKRPSSRNELQWNEIVPKMAEKANKKAGKEIIDGRTKDLILKYLVAMTTAPKK